MTRRSVGIRGKIFAAIAVIAGFTLLATVVATVSFKEISALFEGVAKRNLPNAVATFELAGDSQALATALAPLFAVKTDGERTQQYAAIKAKLDTLTETISGLGDPAADEQAANLGRAIAAVDQSLATQRASRRSPRRTTSSSRSPSRSSSTRRPT